MVSVKFIVASSDSLLKNDSLRCGKVVLKGWPALLSLVIARTLIRGWRARSLVISAPVYPLAPRTATWACSGAAATLTLLGKIAWRAPRSPSLVAPRPLPPPSRGRAVNAIAQQKK